MLTPLQLVRYCMADRDDSSTCRYLDPDELNPDIAHCLKLNPSESKAIDLRVEEHLEFCQEAGLDPHKERMPIGDNCSGFPYLRTILQGVV